MIAAILAIGNDKYSNGVSVAGVAYLRATAVLSWPSPPVIPHRISQTQPLISGHVQYSSDDANQPVAGIDHPSGSVSRPINILATEKLITAEPLVSVLDSFLKQT